MMVTPKRRRLPNGLDAYSLSKTDTQLVYEEIFEDHIYRQHGVTIEDDDVVVDIGANTGLFEIYMQQLGIRPEVFAYEPIFETHDALCRNIALHGIPKVKTFNCGVAATAGSATFAFYPRLSCVSTQFPDESPEEKARTIDAILAEVDKFPTPRIARMLRCVGGFARPWIAERVYRYLYYKVEATVQLRSFPEIIAEQGWDKIDLLKIDAERAEVGILQSLSEEHWSRVRQLIVEVHDDPARSLICDLMDKAGMTVNETPNPFVPEIRVLYGTR